MDTGMEPRLSLSWDKEGDILAIDTGLAPHASPESDFIDDDVWARWNPDTGLIERIEILGFSTHFKRVGDVFQIPVVVKMLRHEPVVSKAR